MIDQICIWHQHVLKGLLAFDGHHKEPALQNVKCLKEVIHAVSCLELFKLALESYKFLRERFCEISYVFTEKASI